MAFEVFDNRPFRSTVPTLTIDKYNRLYLNEAAQKKFCFTVHSNINLYIGYDRINRRIYLAKTNIVKLVDTRPLKFDKRFYAYVKRFVNYYQIDNSETKRYIYVGKDNIGWHMFELEGYDAPDASGQEKMIKERKNKV